MKKDSFTPKTFGKRKRTDNDASEHPRRHREDEGNERPRKRRYPDAPREGQEGASPRRSHGEDRPRRHREDDTRRPRRQGDNSGADRPRRHREDEGNERPRRHREDDTRRPRHQGDNSGADRPRTPRFFPRDDAEPRARRAPRDDDTPRREHRRRENHHEDRRAYNVDNNKNEMRVYGRRAVEALFQRRPQDIIRAYLVEDHLKTFYPLVRYCVDKKLSYRVVDNDELEKVTASHHHEGICVLVKKKTFFASLQDYLDSDPHPAALVALEGVQNPHNLGAILRSCAHFGVSAVLMADPSAACSASAYRVSAGGSEWVSLVSCPDLPTDLLWLQTEKGFRVYTTSSQGRAPSVFQEKFPKSSVFVFGSEEQGLSESILTLPKSQRLQIPHTPHMDSLNVSCAVGVVLAKWFTSVR